MGHLRSPPPGPALSDARLLHSDHWVLDQWNGLTSTTGCMWPKFVEAVFLGGGYVRGVVG